MTFVAATLTPSFMNGQTWWTRLLHGSTYGVKAMGSFWSAVHKETREDADFEHRENLGGFGEIEASYSVRAYLCPSSDKPAVVKYMLYPR